MAMSVWHEGGRRKKQSRIRRTVHSARPATRTVAASEEQKDTCPVIPGQQQAVTFAGGTFSAIETTSAESLWKVFSDEPAGTTTHIQNRDKYRQHFQLGLERLGEDWVLYLIRLLSLSEQTIRAVVRPVLQLATEGGRTWTSVASWLPELNAVFSVYDNYLKDFHRLLRLIATQYRLKQKALRNQALSILLSMYGQSAVTQVRQIQKAYQKVVQSWLDAGHVPTVEEQTKADAVWLTVDLSSIPVVGAMQQFWTRVQAQLEERREPHDDKKKGGDDSVDQQQSKQAFAVKTIKTMGSLLLWFGSTAVVNLVWIGSLSNLNSQGLQFARGALEPLITELPTFKLLIDRWVGSVVPVASIIPYDQVGAAVTPILGATITGYLGTLSSQAVAAVGVAAQVVGAAAAAVGIPTPAAIQVVEFQPGILLTIANRLNTTAGWYFSSSTWSITRFLGETVYTCLSWLLGWAGIKGVLLLALLFFLVTVALYVYQAYRVWSWIAAPLNWTRNLWTRINQSLLKGSTPSASSLRDELVAGGRRYRASQSYRHRRSGGRRQGLAMSDRLWRRPPSRSCHPRNRREGGTRATRTAGRTPNLFSIHVLNKSVQPIRLWWYKTLSPAMIASVRTEVLEGRRSPKDLSFAIRDSTAIDIPVGASKSLSFPSSSFSGDYHRDLFVLGSALADEMRFYEYARDTTGPEIAPHLLKRSWPEHLAQFHSTSTKLTHVPRAARYWGDLVVTDDKHRLDRLSATVSTS